MEKRVQDYSKDILKVIRSNTSPAVMAGRLQDFHENDLADVFSELTAAERRTDCTGTVQTVPYSGHRYAL